MRKDAISQRGLNDLLRPSILAGVRFGSTPAPHPLSRHYAGPAAHGRLRKREGKGGKGEGEEPNRTTTESLVLY
jgi:hypothetical protein